MMLKEKKTRLFISTKASLFWDTISSVVRLSGGAARGAARWTGAERRRAEARSRGFTGFAGT